MPIRKKGCLNSRHCSRRRGEFPEASSRRASAGVVQGHFLPFHTLQYSGGAACFESFHFCLNSNPKLWVWLPREGEQRPPPTTTPSQGLHQKQPYFPNSGDISTCPPPPPSSQSIIPQNANEFISNSGGACAAFFVSFMTWWNSTPPARSRSGDAARLARLDGMWRSSLVDWRRRDWRRRPGSSRRTEERGARTGALGMMNSQLRTRSRARMWQPEGREGTSDMGG